MANKKIQPTSPVESYTVVELKTGGEVYTAKGETVLEAFNKLEQPQIKTKTVLKVIKDGKEFEKFMSVSQMRRFFNNDVSRLTLSKLFSR